MSILPNYRKIEAGQTISVSELPDMFFKDQLLGVVNNADTAKVVIVAVALQGETWAAYIGYPSLGDLKPEFQATGTYHYLCTKVNNVAQVKRLGEKLPKIIAEKLFPDWKNLMYRGQ